MTQSLELWPVIEDMNEQKSCPSCYASIDGRASKCPQCGTRQPDAPALFRNVPGRLLGGVCAALAVHFNVDVTVVRVVMLSLVLITGGVGAWAYIAFWLMTPFDARGQSPFARMLDWFGRLFAPPSTPVPDHHGDPDRRVV